MTDPDQAIISRQQKTIKDMYGEIVELTVELGRFRRREENSGWIPVIAQAIETGKEK